MGRTRFYNRYTAIYVLFTLAMVSIYGCSSTRYVPDGEHLLWKNKLVLNTTKVMVNKGEIKDNLSRIIVQKPNSNYFGFSPVKTPKKLWNYNRRYKKLHNKADSLLPKSVERPVLFDSTTNERSIASMKSYLFNQGYFYADIKDTVEYFGKRTFIKSIWKKGARYLRIKTVYEGKKAIVKYTVNAGPNYLINRVNYNVDDSEIAAICRENIKGTTLKKGKEFTYSLLEEERSRIAAFVANYGYRRFSLENITFKIDTMEKSIFRVAGSPFENAVNYLSQVKSNKKSTLDIDVNIHKSDDSLAYKKYIVGKVIVYPDFMGTSDRTDSSMITRSIENIEFRFHNNYVRSNVLYEHIFLNPGTLYSKALEDKTTTKLGELGIFQYIRIQTRENRLTRDTVDFNIYLNKIQKHDFFTSYEVTNGTTYTLGNSASLNYRNKNFLRGANLLSISVSGGLETFYNPAIEGQAYKRFQMLTQYYGANASLDFPKFLAPVAASLFTNSNMPHTIISGGENVIHRVNYYKLVNSSANFSYSWHQTQTKTWNFSPGFINFIQLPKSSITDSFQKLLESNTYIRNSYKETFIEGENISFKFDNNAKKHGINYSYIKLSFEEAGGVLTAVNSLGTALNELYKIDFSQYTKFDFDARHYFTLQRSVIAVRFYGGLGVPYGNSLTLPYIKQYFAGGPYSLRGWRIRTLGPGSYRDTSSTALQINQIDRTGDTKLELNGEYRFPIAPLFSGALKLNGALFADAGNIWLGYKSTAYPGGEFKLSKLGQDMAMDVGVGTRFDIASFLTIRVDMAIPIKKPYILTNNGWVLDDLNFNDRQWRKDNMVVNLSIGYPF